MPLSILLPMVVLGIAGIAVLLHLLGLTATARLENEAHAATVWQHDYPDLEPTRITLSDDRRAALIQSRQGPGLVWAFGSDFATRALTPDHYGLKADNRGITITTDDYTAPKIILSLTDTERPAWHHALGKPHT